MHEHIFTVNPICETDFDYGNCGERLLRWAWDRVNKTCVTRIWSGCSFTNNQNVFQSQDACRRTCILQGGPGSKQFFHYYIITPKVTLMSILCLSMFAYY